MKNAFLITTGQDMAGWGWRLHSAFERLSKTWHTDAMAATRTYLRYPEHLKYDARTRNTLYRRADVIHLQNHLTGWQRYDRGQGKPTVVQHHGTIYRELHERIGKSARKLGMVEICSTLDLTMYEPGVTWIPVPYNRAELRTRRQRYYQPSDVIRIAHAPTNREVKGTDHFLAIVERLAQLYPIEVILIEQQQWKRCLMLKAGADIYYDQLELGYGSNAVEAWGMGIPVVCGVADPKVKDLMKSTWGRLPFAEATPATLERVLTSLVASRQARAEYGSIGEEHFGLWHDERVVVPWFEEIYASARPTTPGPMNWKK
jgi:hypothetical protein